MSTSAGRDLQSRPYYPGLKIPNEGDADYKSAPAGEWDFDGNR
ncbi:MAG: hypothetical protein Q8T04_15165 [Bacteroidota bacterium]|nr:hypothetical protein [Bacteroidota bacterium]